MRGMRVKAAAKRAAPVPKAPVKAPPKFLAKAAPVKKAAREVPDEGAKRRSRMARMEREDGVV